MRIFLDNCCLNRPWDDQSQIRVHLEAEAVLYLIELVRNGLIELVTSDYLLAEILRQPDLNRRVDVLQLTESACVHVAKSEALETRANVLSSFSIDGYDALHIVAAEGAGCGVFLSTDDRLVSRCKRAAAASVLNIQVLSQIEFLSSYPP